MEGSVAWVIENNTSIYHQNYNLTLYIQCTIYIDDTPRLIIWREVSMFTTAALQKVQIEVWAAGPANTMGYRS